MGGANHWDEDSGVVVVAKVMVVVVVVIWSWWQTKATFYIVNRAQGTTEI